VMRPSPTFNRHWPTSRSASATIGATTVVRFARHRRRNRLAGCRSVVRRALAVPAARPGRFPALLHLPPGRARRARHQHRVRAPAGVGAGGGAGAARPGRRVRRRRGGHVRVARARACSTS
jgi:hypothetical protein